MEAVSVEIVPVLAGQADILANLLELYIHDFSEFLPVELGAGGRFGYPLLPLYWSDPERHPCFIRAKGKLAGLILAHRTRNAANAPVWDVAEFFLLRRYRKQGIGRVAVHALWHSFPAAWQVRVMQSNTPAVRLWAGAISSFTGRVSAPSQYTQNGEGWLRFSFESGMPISSRRD